MSGIGLRNHYFVLYFPEVERFIRSSYVDWLVEFCVTFPRRRSSLSPQQFTEQAWKLIGRKVNETALLAEIYATAQRSIGVPAELDSSAVAMFRLVLEEYLELSRLRDTIASRGIRFGG